MSTKKENRSAFARKKSSSRVDENKTNLPKQLFDRSGMWFSGDGGSGGPTPQFPGAVSNITPFDAGATDWRR